MRRRLRSALGTLALVVVGVAGGVVALELVLDAASLVAGRELTVAPPGAGHVVVLCVGDSHTWGGGQGYPAALAERLAARSPRYRVVNLGVPGSNTAQLRHRFDGYLDRFGPRVVVLQSGINNAWNHTEAEYWFDAAAPPPSLAQRLLARSRLVRFVTVWREQQALRRTLESSGALMTPTMYNKPDDPRFTFRRDVFGEEDVMLNTKLEQDLPQPETRRVTELDVRWLIERARARGAPTVLITYALPTPANFGIMKAAEDLAVPIVSTGTAMQRIQARYAAEGREAPQLFDASAHPMQELYAEIGIVLLETMDRAGMLPPDDGAETR